MAALPEPTERLIERYGPRLNHTPPGGWAERGPVERVKTHCCFCGVQCGIQLKVQRQPRRRLRAVGGVPGQPRDALPQGREALPAERAIPTGCCRRWSAARAGSREAGWDEALDRVADAIQKHPGPPRPRRRRPALGRVAHQREGLPHGQVRPGRAQDAPTSTTTAGSAWSSAGAANRKAFGIDRARQPLERHPARQVRDRGRRQRRRVFPDPHRLPLARARQRRQPHRRRPAPHADRAHGRPLPARAPRPRQRALATASCTSASQARLGRPRFRRPAHHTASTEVRARGRRLHARAHRADHGRAGARPSAPRPRWWAAGADRHAAARARHRAPHQGHRELPGLHQPRAGHRQDRPPGQRLLRRITGQGNGQGGREHGQRCNQLPSGRDIENPQHRAVVAERWGVPEAELPGAGHGLNRDDRRPSTGARSAGCSRSASTRSSPCPTPSYTRAALEKLEFFGVIDFFLSETARHADVVLAGSLHEEDEGTVTTAEGRVVRIRQAVTPPGEARRRLGDHRATSRGASGAGEHFAYDSPRRRSSTSCAASRRAARSTTPASPTRGSSENHGVFWPCPSADHPGTPRLFEGGPVLPSRRQGALPRRGVPPARGGRRTRSIPSSSPRAAWSRSS